MTTEKSQRSTSNSEKNITPSSDSSRNDLGELNITEWRLMLSDFARNLKEGTVSPVAANAFANLMGKGLGSYKLQLEYAKATGRTPSIEGLMAAMEQDAA